MTPSTIETAELPPASKEEFDHLKDRIRAQFPTLFANPEQLTYFCMLPLSYKQKVELIQKLYKKEKCEQ